MPLRFEVGLLHDCSSSFLCYFLLWMLSSPVRSLRAFRAVPERGRRNSCELSVRFLARIGPGSGQILARSWPESGQTLAGWEGHRASFWPDLASTLPDPGPIPPKSGRIRARISPASGPILARFWPGSAQKARRNSVGLAQKPPRKLVGIVQGRTASTKETAQTSQKAILQKSQFESQRHRKEIAHDSLRNLATNAQQPHIKRTQSSK